MTRHTAKASSGASKMVPFRMLALVCVLGAAVAAATAATDVGTGPVRCGTPAPTADVSSALAKAAADRLTRMADARARGQAVQAFSSPVTISTFVHVILPYEKAEMPNKYPNDTLLYLILDDGALMVCVREQARILFFAPKLDCHRRCARVCIATPPVKPAKDSFEKNNQTTAPFHAYI